MGREYVEVECGERWSPNHALMVPEPGDDAVTLEVEYYDDEYGQLLLASSFTPDEAWAFATQLIDFATRIEVMRS